LFDCASAFYLSELIKECEEEGGAQSKLLQQFVEQEQEEASVLVKSRACSMLTPPRLDIAFVDCPLRDENQPSHRGVLERFWRESQVL
jgi:hypothetical protein